MDLGSVEYLAEWPQAWKTGNETKPWARAMNHYVGRSPCEEFCATWPSPLEVTNLREGAK